VFLGHFAVAFAAKKLSPTVSLGTLVLAAQLADLVWPLLVFAGIERFEIVPGATAFTPLFFSHYPYSHSLVALLAWGIALGGTYALVRRARLRAAILLGALVVSHWVLDYVTHAPDMPLTIGGADKVGLGLWNSIPGTLLAEALLLVAGAVVYARATVARDRVGRFAFYGLLAFLIAVYIASFAGPPPPSVAAVAGPALAMWLLVAWGYWIDRHRAPA
jgi:membrane-bound metal-dependent hydrolase YbcI (DUF457 family)